jgi:neutral ceramidase
MKAANYFQVLVLILCVSPMASVHAAFRAGAAKSNITPHLGTSLDGTISQNGPALQVHDELHARCLVLDDGSTRMAIVVCDSTMIDRSVHDHAKAIIKERCGLATDRILISATHTHAAPRSLPGLTDNPLNTDYHDFIARRIADAVELAIGNLAPAKIGWASFDKPEFVHNRRWYMKPGSEMGNPFGKDTDQVRMNGRGDDLLKPAGPVDPEFFLLSVQHENGRPLSLLANYGTHYVGGYEKGHVSADYFGLFSETIASRLMEDWHKENPGEDSLPPFVAMMSNGTSGDVRSTDLSKPAAGQQPWEQVKQVALSITSDVETLYQNIDYQEAIQLKMIQRELFLGVRKPSSQQIAWAKNTWNELKRSSADPVKSLSRSQVYAREALSLAEYPDEKSILIQAIRIGDLAIVSSPCETFAETGLAIKKRSPFPNTFTIELANGADGYLPTFEQHQLGGYETWAARSSFLEVTAERKIRIALLELLEQLHAE